MGLWLALMAAAFTLANYQLVAIQSIAFFIVALLWPTAAVLVKRLHDRNKAGWWALLLIPAWMLAAGADAGADLAMGRRAFHSDADYRDDDDRSGCLRRHAGITGSARPNR